MRGEDGIWTGGAAELRAARRAVRTVALLAALAWAVGMGGAADCAAEAAGEEREVYLSEYNGVMPIWKAADEIDTSPRASQLMIIFEVSRYPDEPPTPKQEEAAEELRRASLEAARRHGWFDFARAQEDGFELMPLDTAHYANREFIADGRTLDPDRPEFLLYFDTDQGKRLAGFMYLVSAPEESGPQIGGPLTVWHYHVWYREHCMWRGLMTIGMVDREGNCEEGIPSERSPEMLHVWFMDRRHGPFSTDMSLEPFQVKQLERRGY